ncbi:hypothetical protein Misp02_70420 [Microtetraspora sp. NBRC 16547]|nr:hypothetical protein Misp02_70420 [Microtetraspora sp. NBRC 16547]
MHLAVELVAITWGLGLDAVRDQEESGCDIPGRSRSLAVCSHSTLMPRCGVKWKRSAEVPGVDPSRRELAERRLFVASRLSLISAVCGPAENLAMMSSPRPGP